MIHFEEFTLENGLEVIIHPDHKVSTVCVNTLYKVGSRNEHPDKTGFAHLFEHLMFGGSKNVKEFDSELQKVGGENNAFTSSDLTNYFTTVPSINLETALWVESDRMLSLSFDPEVLEVQRKVVIEEFKQQHLNQPYGDLWLKLRPEAYKVHPYRWATIGKEISHIEDATLDYVKDFFHRYYNPSNAVLVLAGDITVERGRELVEKWYANIPAGPVVDDIISPEPRQTESRFLEVTADVPQNTITRVYHMPGRKEPEYYAADLVSDILGRGKSSMLYNQLVRDSEIFSSASSYITGNMDPGLLVINGNLNNGSFDNAEELIDKVIEELLNKKDISEELDKVKNMGISSLVFSEVDVLNRAMSLAYAKNLGNVDLVNKERENIEAVEESEVLTQAQNILRPDNCTTLHYCKK